MNDPQTGETDRGDERVRLILKNIRTVRGHNGRVTLLERVMLPENQPDFGKLIDIEMPLMPGENGWCRFCQTSGTRNAPGS